MNYIESMGDLLSSIKHNTERVTNLLKDTDDTLDNIEFPEKRLVYFSPISTLDTRDKFSINDSKTKKQLGTVSVTRKDGELYACITIGTIKTFTNQYNTVNPNQYEALTEEIEFILDGYGLIARSKQ